MFPAVFRQTVDGANDRQKSGKASAPDELWSAIRRLVLVAKCRKSSFDSRHKGTNAWTEEVRCVISRVVVYYYCRGMRSDVDNLVMWLLSPPYLGSP